MNLVDQAIAVLPLGDVPETVMEAVAKAIHDADIDTSTVWPTEGDDLGVGTPEERGYVRLCPHDRQAIYRQAAYDAVRVFRSAMLAHYTPAAEEMEGGN